MTPRESGAQGSCFSGVEHHPHCSRSPQSCGQGRQVGRRSGDSKPCHFHTLSTGTAQQAQEGSAYFPHSSLAAGTECPFLDSNTWHQPDPGSSQASQGQFHLQSLWLPTTQLGSIHRPDAQAGSPPHTRQAASLPASSPTSLQHGSYMPTRPRRGRSHRWARAWPHSPLADDDNDGPQEEDEDSKSPRTDAQDEPHLL